MAHEAQLLVAHVALVNAAERAQHMGRPAVGPGIPAAEVLEPQAATGVAATRAEAVLDLEGNAASRVDEGAAHHRVIAAGHVLRVEMRGEEPPRLERGGGDAQNRRGIG